MTNQVIPEAAVKSPFLASCDFMEEGDQYEFDTFHEAVTVCDGCCTIAGWHAGSSRYVIVRPAK